MAGLVGGVMALAWPQSGAGRLVRQRLRHGRAGRQRCPGGVSLHVSRDVSFDPSIPISRRPVRPATHRPPIGRVALPACTAVATALLGQPAVAPDVLPGIAATFPTGPQPPSGDPGPLYTPYGSPDAMAAARPPEPSGNAERWLAGDEPWTWQVLPTGLMYKSYLAGGREPRFGTQFVHERSQGWLWDTTLGARVGLVRYGTDNDLWPEGWQLDVEGAAFPRLMLEHDRDLNSVDFRAGMPLTYRVGPWEMKFGYYHYCSHLGDEFVLTHPEVTRIDYVRETLIFGLAAYLSPRLAVVRGGGLGVPRRGRDAALGVPVRRRLEFRRADRPRRRPLLRHQRPPPPGKRLRRQYDRRDRLAVARRDRPPLPHRHAVLQRHERARPVLRHLRGTDRRGPVVRFLAAVPFSGGLSAIMDAMPRRFFIHTVGCQMNVLDSELIAAELMRAGYEQADSLRRADIILFNTCSVRQHAEDKIYSALGRLKHVKASRAAEEADRSPRLHGPKGPARDSPPGPARGPGRGAGPVGAAAGALGAGRRRRRAVPGTEPRPGRRRSGGGGAELRPLQPAADARRIDEPRPVVAPQAMVRIMSGCDKLCSYCVVPRVRGPEQSRPAAEILDEVRQLAGQGCLEVTLLGQTVNSYRDRTGPRTLRLADLLEKLNQIEGLRRLKFVTNHPRHMTDDLLQAVRDLPKVSPYLHVPAQSGSDAVLRRMKRGYGAAFYREMLARIRQLIPHAAVTSDFIVGFCGETEEDFQRTAELVREARFKNSFIFKYSPRPGTPAAELYEDDVPEAVKRRRNNELLAIQNAVSLEDNQPFLGRSVEILVEGPSKVAKKRAGGQASLPADVGPASLPAQGRDEEATPSCPHPNPLPDGQRGPCSLSAGPSATGSWSSTAPPS